MAINDDTHHHEAHGDASLTGDVLHDWIYCEVLEWEEKGKEVRTIPHKPSHTNTNAHQLHQGNFEFCHWRKFDISKSFVK